MYEVLLNILSAIFQLKLEICELHKPLETENWVYSETKDMVYKIYITNYKKGKRGCYFGFYEYDEKIGNMYKKALIKLIPKLSYSIKRNIQLFFEK